MSGEEIDLQNKMQLPLCHSKGFYRFMSENKMVALGVGKGVLTLIGISVQNGKGWKKGILSHTAYS